MAYIREKSEVLTGYQASEPYRESVDFGCDFVMVYGIDDSMPERVRQYRDKGYVVHLMTGIAWGEYQDYLDGKWDGRKHWDEGQVDRQGRDVSHGPTVPYMVPTIAFADYMTERMKIAVDCGVEAIHVEEPEFWDKSGYSKAFAREYEIFYHEPFKPQHTDLDSSYRCAKLKAYLYKRTIERVSGALKEYAKVKYAKDLKFYVPTHSLINYTQWKILSPQAQLLEIPTVDGYIAQIWTGTSREPNVYEGVKKERTFETAYLEYGVMQELVNGTGRRMWFLNDPIEDRPSYTWENYEYNYRKTATASLLHPYIHHYEICPWPHRVFEEKYPKVRAGLETKEGKMIPEHYATYLSGMFQLFGDMDQNRFYFENLQENVGVLVSDSGLYQRTFPDSVEKTQTLEFIESIAFPQFYGLTMPLLKYGLPIRPVLLDNVRRYADYLKNFKYLILSYEYIKPQAPDVNTTLAGWIRNGGTLFYVGDGSDPYHRIDFWWKKDGYDTPAAHLFEQAGISKDAPGGVYEVGKGRLIIWHKTPAEICLKKELSDRYRDWIRDAIEEAGGSFTYTNHITLHRGPYIISAVMDESVSEERKVFDGLFADMSSCDYQIVTRKEIGPDENTILFDFAVIEEESLRVIGCSARVMDLTCTETDFNMRVHTADNIRAYIRIRTPYEIQNVKAVDSDGNAVAVEAQWDENTRTMLFEYESYAKQVKIHGGKK
ncbi:MAG: hypothetical protein K6G30_14440 [Acetatifactor sp.]|nr:hypothetical protein [Acetatifactor sp.]